MGQVMRLYAFGSDVLSRPRYGPYFALLCFGADSILTFAIIKKVPYTEIDFSTYMSHISLIISGERDYSNVDGPTGPLVYPAGHVLLYSMLYWMTGQGQDIQKAQFIFGGLYLLTLSVVMAVAVRMKLPPYIFPLFILSKRLHSIFLLRLFNDCFATLALWTSVFFLQRRYWLIGALIYSFGVSIKMTLLVGLPGLTMVLFQALPDFKPIQYGAFMGIVQVMLGLPFLVASPEAYLGRAFDFSRQFLFKWTVNWTLVGQDLFLSSKFATALLLTNLQLDFFFAFERWNYPSSLSPISLVTKMFRPLPSRTEDAISHRLTPSFIAATIISSMMIGMLCARSLHYQFYAYIAWSTPIMLWKADFHPIAVYAIYFAQEWAWNVYPSTENSSKAVVACLALQIVGFWWGTRDRVVDYRDLPGEVSKRQSAG